MEDWREKQDALLNGLEETLPQWVQEQAAAMAAAASEERRGTKRKPSQETSPEKKNVKRNRKQVCSGDPNTNANVQHLEEEDDSSQIESEKEKEQPALLENQLLALQKQCPPTNDEIEAIIHARDPRYCVQRNKIREMYQELRQLSNEKKSTANQVKAMVDMALGRLNRDLEKFGKELGIDPSKSATATAPNDGTFNGEGKTDIAGGRRFNGVHTSSGSVPVGAGQPVSNNQIATFSGPVANNPNRTIPLPAASNTQPLLPMSTAMQFSMQDTTTPLLKSVQTYLAAIQVTPNSPDWILAKILSYDKVSRTYALSDEDVHSNQLYNIPEKQVVELKGTERNKWTRGDVVYAVYPDTTSFYHATVSTTPATNPPLNKFVMVQFKDDRDANGVTHEKAVLLAHVMKVPPGKK